MTTGEMAALTERFKDASNSGDFKEARLLNFMNDLKESYGLVINNSTTFAYQLYVCAEEEL